MKEKTQKTQTPAFPLPKHRTKGKKSQNANQVVKATMRCDKPDTDTEGGGVEGEEVYVEERQVEDTCRSGGGGAWKA